MAYEVKASLRHLPIAPTKVRLVIDLVRGKDLDDALAILKFMPQRAAEPVRKLVQSAAANAEQNFGLNPEDLYILQIHADEGPRRNWRRFGARGRWKPIIRRSSHVTVVLSEHEGVAEEEE